MSTHAISKRSFRVLSGLSSVVGVLMLALSFAINPGPPHNASYTELIKFGQSNFGTILWGAWLQAVSPVLIVLFAFALVHLAGATQRLAGWMTLFGATVLTTTSLIEVTFYISALFPDPPVMPTASLQLIHAVQHLFFFVASPALFFPLGIVLLDSSVLPRAFAYLALILAAGFGALGLIFLYRLTLPDPVTAAAFVQGIWWLAAGMTLIFSRGAKPMVAGTNHQAHLTPDLGLN